MMSQTPTQSCFNIIIYYVYFKIILPLIHCLNPREWAVIDFLGHMTRQIILILWFAPLSWRVLRTPSMLRMDAASMVMPLCMWLGMTIPPDSYLNIQIVIARSRENRRRPSIYSINVWGCVGRISLCTGKLSGSSSSSACSTSHYSLNWASVRKQISSSSHFRPIQILLYEL